MSEDYFDNLLKERVKKCIRPFQYLLVHILVMVATIITMAFGLEFEVINDAIFMTVLVPLILSMIAHALWYGNLALRQRIEFEEIEKMRDAEKPKRNTRRLEDGELVDYNDFLHADSEIRQDSSTY